MPPIAPARLNRWFRRHSLTLVATLGGAAGVAFAVARLGGAAPPAPHAGPPPVALVQPAEAPPRDTVVDTIQVALLLDTSSSMDGLINQARSHLWKMVDQLGRMTRVVDGKVRGVKIELAIFEYGNDTLPEEAATSGRCCRSRRTSIRRRRSWARCSPTAAASSRARRSRRR